MTEGLGSPWQSNTIRDLNNMFDNASKVWRIEHGFSVGNLRTEIPGAGLAYVIELAAEARRESLRRAEDTMHQAHRKVSWMAVFLVMLMYWFRADTIAGYRPGDITFNDVGAMNFVVRRLKRGKAHVQPFSKCIPCPTTGRSKRIFLVIQHAIGLRAGDGEFWFSDYIWGNAPTTVSDRITQAMAAYLDAKQLFMPEGSFISSHSWRKTGASAYAASQGDWHLLMRWGMWKAIASAEAYINRDFQHDPIVSEIFSWLFSINGREHVSVPGTMYESDSD
eukprot:SAG11_NODE_8911_length_963_cov_3.038194_1_plen_277_part_01